MLSLILLLCAPWAVKILLIGWKLTNFHLKKTKKNITAERSTARAGMLLTLLGILLCSGTGLVEAVTDEFTVTLQAVRRKIET